MFFLLAVILCAPLQASTISSGSSSSGSGSFYLEAEPESDTIEPTVAPTVVDRYLFNLEQEPEAETSSTTTTVTTTAQSEDDAISAETGLIIAASAVSFILLIVVIIKCLQPKSISKFEGL